MLSAMMFRGKVEPAFKVTHEMLVCNQNPGYGYKRNSQGNYMNPTQCEVYKGRTMNINEFFVSGSVLFFRGVDVMNGTMGFEDDIRTSVQYIGGVVRYDETKGRWTGVEEFCQYLKVNVGKKIKLRIAME